MLAMGCVLLSCGALLCSLPVATFATEPPQNRCPTAADIVHSANELCSASQIVESLMSVGLLLDIKDDKAAPVQLLQKHGTEWQPFDPRSGSGRHAKVW